MSLRHVPLRGTGWSRNPTSSGVAEQSRDQRVRRRTGNSANTPFLLQGQNFHLAEDRSTLLAGPLRDRDLQVNLPRGEKRWVTKKTQTLRRKAQVTSTTPSPSKFSAVSKQSGCVPPCTSARPAKWACTISSGKWWTTRSTRPWPVSQTKSM